MNNCHNCKHLEWIEDDSEVSNNSGWVCNKRVYSEKHLEQLENERYRKAPKKCFEAPFTSAKEKGE